MKKYLLLLISLTVLSSCSMRKENAVTSLDDQKSLLMKHSWNGVDMAQYLNNHQNGKTSLKNLNYSFDKVNHFILKDNGQIIREGMWHLLNISDQPVLRLSYDDTDQNQIIDDYEISILTEDYLQLSAFTTDVHGNMIQKDYFFSK